jgi:transcriptional regulator with XRE-family HTH domain
VGVRNLKRRKAAPVKQRDIVHRFAARLKVLREERKLSHHRLAELAGIHWSYLSRLEQGHSAPGVDLVEKLAAALGVSIADLLPSERTDRTAALKAAIQTQTESIMADAEEGDLSLLNSLLSVFQRGMTRRR